VRLRGGGNILSTPADVDTVGTCITVVPISAQQTVTSLPSVAAAVINNGFALDADLDPSSAIYNDDPNSPALHQRVRVAGSGQRQPHLPEDR